MKQPDRRTTQIFTVYCISQTVLLAFLLICDLARPYFSKIVARTYDSTLFMGWEIISHLVIGLIVFAVFKSYHLLKGTIPKSRLVAANLIFIVIAFALVVVEPTVFLLTETGNFIIVIAALLCFMIDDIRGK